MAKKKDETTFFAIDLLPGLMTMSRRVRADERTRIIDAIEALRPSRGHPSYYDMLLPGDAIDMVISVIEKLGEPS